ncbi:hypothetical protein HanPI659440_Chr04g0183351 [Helianthus annuus]|nr:hypothetical protein HanPI659440_Chr04g0183351 [Helianthus annuus]
MHACVFICITYIYIYIPGTFIKNKETRLTLVNSLNLFYLFIYFFCVYNNHFNSIYEGVRSQKPHKKDLRPYHKLAFQLFNLARPRIGLTKGRK